MAALPTMAKVMIIQSLACYEPPSRIVELVKQDFGIVVTGNRYRPTTRKYNG
jgi:hypothetical protein